MNFQEAIEKLLKERDDVVAEALRRDRDRISEIEAKLTAPNFQRSVTAPGLDGYETPGRRLIENKSILDTFRQTRRARFEIGSFWPAAEQKALIDSASLGFGTPGVMPTVVLPGVVTLPRRRLTIRDLLRSRPIVAGQVGWIRETSFVNAASPQVEGSTKAESAMDLDLSTAPVRTVAHYVHCTKQALDDLPALREYIDGGLIYGLKLKEELEVLSGDGLGVHLLGIMNQAGNYGGSYNVASDTKLDKLRHAILELSDLEEQANGFVLHPKDFHDIELIKDEAGGAANVGKYVASDPLGGLLAVPTLWGRPVVQTNSIQAGTFLAGDFSAAMIGDRMASTIDVSEEHGNNFIENKVTIRAEERIALAVTRSTAFLQGAF